MKKMLSGNEAIARGAYEAGVGLAAAYPGTPSTEVLETIERDFPLITAQWAPNEKVALEVVAGAGYAGARCMAVMKHVGVNVAADPLMTLPYTLVRGGLVLVSADDPELFSSQNEQDNRHYARFAKIPLLEPSSSQEAKVFTKAAFDLSEEFGTPVMLRSTTRISHSKGVVDLGPVMEVKAASLERHPAEWVMLPVNARRRHPLIEERIKGLSAYSDNCIYNTMEIQDAALGIISSGVAYQYAKEAFPNASFLKIGMSYPLPEGQIKKFASKVKELWVIEELDPFMEDQIRAMGIECHGKDAVSMCGELSTQAVTIAISGMDKPAIPTPDLPARPPGMCPGCPHRGMLWALKKNKCFIAGDIGCYTLGALPPLDAIDTCLCMGAGINHAHGMQAVFGEQRQPVAAVIGDSTFFHSGMTGLVNLAYNNGNALIVILDNRTTAMTGAQDHPGTGVMLDGTKTIDIDMEALVRALGIKWVKTIDPYDIKNARTTVKEAIDHDGPTVIISKAPCVLLKSRQVSGKVLRVDEDKCTGCKICLSIGCPAIEFRDKKAIISDACVGCNICVDLCPTGAIGGDA
ncbi:MAG: indolepyruvate ferredoxin oxidoreductase subunit alpha [Thermodesulfobacteriota bacterium]|nr:indolepyruvate ferredoxin oxidoreductase subunit alpha [Thermodesulfobacteriota bacterium]